MLCYNGELYNYREIRADLAAGGAAFTTGSDTEVVLEAWRRWGPGCLRRFRGMFAFAILDQSTGSLFLARDQFGIKPLHYMRRKDGVVFASELKALVAAFGSELHMRPTGARRLHALLLGPRSDVLVAGCRQAASPARGPSSDPTARAASSGTGTSSKRQLPPRRRSYDLREVIEDSVNAHLVADVPVSSFLSGGLDSSIVTVLAKQANPQIDAYTITFRAEDQRLEAMPDDAIYARKVAERHGIDLHEIELQPDVVDLLPRMVDILDEPDRRSGCHQHPCSCRRRPGPQESRSSCRAWVRTSSSGATANTWRASWPGRYRGLPSFVHRSTNGVVERLPVTAAGRGLRYARWAKRFVDVSPSFPRRRHSAGVTASTTRPSWLRC